MKAYKVHALMKKDFKDALKNLNCLFMVILPLFFVMLYNSIGIGEHMPPTFVMMLGLQMNMALIPVSALAMMVAEEKEKHTLRTLMLANVSAPEFLLSKLIIGYSMMQLVNVAIFFLCSQPVSDLLRYFLITSLGSVPTLILGASIGLISKNQMSTGILAAPAALLLLIPSMFSQIMPDGFLAKIARATPNDAVARLLLRDGSALLSVVVLVVWIILVGFLFSLAYHKLRADK